MVVRVTETPQEAPTIAKEFAQLKDPRKGNLRYHKFLDVLTIGICAVICGADDYEAIAEFGRAKAEWLETFLELPRGIPAHDTFWRVFEALNPEQFQHCFLKWMAGVRKIISREVIALDGKRLRRSYAKEDDKAAIHMVSAWATANRLVLGQQKVDEKSNEITAIPELLRALDIEGCIVTIDAMGCQTAIADLIVEGKGDYLLSLKGNQSNLHEDVVLLFDDLIASDFTAYPSHYARTVDKEHGRIEIRHCWTIDFPSLCGSLRGADNWRNLTTLIKVRAERRVNNKRSVEDRYFIASYRDTPEHILAHTRQHWHIENSLHWVLDIAFREDDSRIRKGNGPQNFALLRHIALNLLKHDSSSKLGIKNRRLRAGWNNDYLFSLLSPLLS
ncbi:MAG: ISAs1 family transposase [Caldilineaceae bacterium]|nr:ISAs1 family transposase [Caldilineaceae bacterium]